MTAPDEKAIALEMTRLVAFRNERVETAMVKAITAALIEARRAALEEAAKVALGKSGEFDFQKALAELRDAEFGFHNGRICAADHIRALIPTCPDGAAEGISDPSAVPVNRNTGLPCDHSYVRIPRGGAKWQCDLCGIDLEDWGSPKDIKPHGAVEGDSNG